MKKIILVLLFIAFTNTAFAQSVSFTSSNENPAIGEEFYIDLNLETNNKNINAIESELSFDKNLLKLNRFDTSKSFITHWIDQLKNENSIKIAGIVPNGFGGYINNPILGNVTRLYFTPVKSGPALVNVSNTFVTENDGNGTVLPINPVSFLINISSEVKNKNIEIKDFIKPELEAFILKNSLINDNKPMLVFNVIDKDSGLEGVYVKSKTGWQKIQSPYSLDTFEYRGILTIKAVDFAGNETIKRFIAYRNSNFIYYILIFALGLSIFVFFKKNVFKIKNKF